MIDNNDLDGHLVGELAKFSDEMLPAWASESIRARALASRYAIIQITGYNPLGEGLRRVVERVVRRSIADFREGVLERQLREIKLFGVEG